jgi:uncharacterized membrane protein YfcA
LFVDAGASFYLAAGVSLFLIGLSKGGVGGMLGPLITATMALAVPADEAIGLLLPLLIAGDAFAIAAHWGKWARQHVIRLLPASVIGVAAAALVVADISPAQLRRGLGLVILLFIGYRLLEGRLIEGIDYRSRPWHGRVAGVVAGFTSGLAHVGGPPVSIYLLLQRLPPPTYAATSALFFAVLNLIKVPFYGLAGLFNPSLVVRTIPLLPLLPTGVWAGKRFAQRVRREIFEAIILGLLLLSAVFLLLRP